MKHTLIYIIWLCAFWVFLPLHFAWAENLMPMAYETALLDKINEARENPLAMAESFGIDPDTLLQELPELQHILINGLLPVSFNTDVYQAARAHVADMVSQRYYDYTSLNGDSVKDRIAATGYNVFVSDESLGMLGFFNYISPEMAVDRIFESMFRSELDPGNLQNRKILNPAFRDAGAAMDAGLFQIGPSQVNVYVAACDFAAKPMWIFENEYLALINQARANPLAMAEVLGMDPDEIIKDNLEISDLLKNGVAPVVFNRHLYESATAHGRDMIKNAYFSRISEDGRRIADRISDTGYQAAESDEVIGSIFGSTTISLKNMAFQIFATKFKAEINRSKNKPLILLNPDFTDAGLSLLAIYVKNDDTGEASKYLMMVVDFAKSAEPTLWVPGSSTLWAMVYDDKDDNEIYSPGEECGGTLVTVKGNGLYFKTITDFVGRVVVTLPAGSYRIQTDETDSGERVGTFFEIKLNIDKPDNDNRHDIWLRVDNEQGI